MKYLILATAIASQSFPIYAQEAQETAPALTQAPAPVTAVQAVRVSAQPAVFLPANTEVLLRMNQEVTTKGRTWSEGDTFNMSVVHNVMLGDYVIVPSGTRAIGRITWLTSKGAFGKSGKMDIEVEYLELNGRRINLDGTYRQEGEGNTVATVAGVIVASVFAGFITGRSGRIPQGREMMATLESDLPVALPSGASVSQANAPIAAQLAAVVPVAPATPTPAVESQIETSETEPAVLEEAEEVLE